MTSRKRDLVQLKNPRTGHYVKIDRDEGRIIGHQKSAGPYKNIAIAGMRSRDELRICAVLLCGGSTTTLSS